MSRLVSMFVALLAAVSWGCRPSNVDSTTENHKNVEPLRPVRLLVVDDPELSTVIQRQWQSVAERDIVIRDIDAQQLLDDDARRLGADAVVYPSGMLGELAERTLIEPFAKEDLNDTQFARRDIFELPRLHEVVWGREIYAVSFGSPVLTLMYRADVFERLQAAPPATWAEYRSLAERLAERDKLQGLVPSDESPWLATIEPLGPGWAGQVLLARAAAYARHRSQYSTFFDYRTMQPLIDGPPFVRALTELADAAPYLPRDVANYSPSDARRELLKGHCAMALTWPSHADDQSSSDSEFSIGFAELPGASQVYNSPSRQWEPRGDESQSRVTLASISGRMGSVTRESRQPHVAANMLIWLAGELSGEVCPASKHTTLFRESHLDHTSKWLDSQIELPSAQLYGDVVQQAQNRIAWVCSPRIPGRARYLAALDRAVQQVLDGDLDAERALRQAAKEWNEITDTAGRDQQRLAYTRSIGLEP